MTSLSRVQTEGIPPLSLERSTEAPAQPSSPLVSSDNTQTSTETMSKPSEPISTTEPSGSDNSPTTPKITEITRQHAMLMRTALLQLEKAGLCKRFRVLSKDGETVKEIQVVFSPDLWTTGLSLKVLSE